MSLLSLGRPVGRTPSLFASLAQGSLESDAAQSWDEVILSCGCGSFSPSHWFQSSHFEKLLDDGRQSGWRPLAVFLPPGRKVGVWLETQRWPEVEDQVGEGLERTVVSSRLSASSFKEHDSRMILKRIRATTRKKILEEGAFFVSFQF